MVTDLDAMAVRLGHQVLEQYGHGMISWYYTQLINKRDAIIAKTRLKHLDMTQEEMNAGFATIGLMWMMLGGFKKVAATPGLAEEALPNMVAGALLKTTELSLARNLLRN